MSILEVALQKVNERGQPRPPPGPCQCPESDTVARGPVFAGHPGVRGKPVDASGGRSLEEDETPGRPIRAPSWISQGDSRTLPRCHQAPGPSPSPIRARPIWAREGATGANRPVVGTLEGPDGGCRDPLDGEPPILAARRPHVPRLVRWESAGLEALPPRRERPVLSPVVRSPGTSTAGSYCGCRRDFPRDR